MSETRLTASVWNEHEEPTQFPQGEDLNAIQYWVVEQLQTKEYGKIVRLYSASKHVPEGELALYYRAFTDAYRGRQIVSGVDLADLDSNYQQRKKQCLARVMSPAELYALKPIRVDYDSWHTLHVHLSNEVGYFDSDIDIDKVGETKRFETRSLVDFDYDGRRVWMLQTVWFDGKPVMVVTSSGRDADEYNDRWITDGKTFGELIQFLNSFKPDPEPSSEFVEASTKIPAMTEFYGHTIHDYYDVDAQEPKKV